MVAFVLVFSGFCLLFSSLFGRWFSSNPDRSAVISTEGNLRRGHEEQGPFPIKALVLVFTVGRLEAPVHLGSYVYTIFLPHFGQKCYRENLSYASDPQGVPRVLYAIQKPHTFFNIAISLQGHTYQAACIPLGLGIGISRSQLQFLMSTSRKRYTSSGIEKKCYT